MTIETIKSMKKVEEALAKWDLDKSLDGEMFTLPDLIARYYPGEGIKISGLVQEFYKRFPKEKGGEITLNGHRYKIAARDDKTKPAFIYEIVSLP